MITEIIKHGKLKGLLGLVLINFVKQKYNSPKCLFSDMLIYRSEKYSLYYFKIVFIALYFLCNLQNNLFKLSSRIKIPDDFIKF